MKQEIEERLQSSWSPEQICGRYQLENKPMVSFKTVYNCYAGTILRGKGKSQSPQETRRKFPIGISISKRPKEVKMRETVGHWELDTVVSSREKSKGCLATFIERKTSLYMAF